MDKRGRHRVVGHEVGVGRAHGKGAHRIAPVVVHRVLEGRVQLVEVFFAKAGELKILAPQAGIKFQAVYLRHIQAAAHAVGERAGAGGAAHFVENTGGQGGKKVVGGRLVRAHADGHGAAGLHPHADFGVEHNFIHPHLAALFQGQRAPAQGGHKIQGPALHLNLVGGQLGVVKAEATGGQRAAHREVAAGVVVVKLLAVQPHQHRVEAHERAEAARYVGQLHRAAHPKHPRREGVVARLDVSADAQLVHHRIDAGREPARDVAVLDF